MARGNIPENVQALLRRGRGADAIAVLQRMLGAEPRNAAVRELLVSLRIQAGDQAFGAERFGEAVGAYGEALTLEPASLQARFNRGVALYQSGDLEGAAADYLAALAIRPSFAPGLSALGVVRAEQGRGDEAIELHRSALALDAGNPEFHNNLGLALDAANRPAEALAGYDAALALARDYGTAWLNRGVALHRLWRLPAALASIDSALTLDPSDAQAWSNRGLVLNDLGRSAEALESDRRATELQPGLANAWANRAATCMRLKRYDEAVAAYERTFEAGGESLGLRADLLHTRMLLCDWSRWSEDLERIERGLRDGHETVQPFVLLATPLGPALQKLAAERLVEAMQPLPSLPCEPHTGHGRLRIAYFSADLRQHPMMYLMAEVFEAHDRDRFETIAYAYGPPTDDAMRQRAIEAFDRFVDISELSDDEAAALARSDGIDIAIDLAGFTRNSRPGILARRVAPVQASYLGYPGTLGAPYIDYVIADATVIPERLKPNYTEKVARLPRCYMGNEAWRPIEAGTIDRAAAGLPEGAFVFCCFNNNYKITPDVFEVWMRLLDRVPGSVLWLLEGHASVVANLRREAERRGVAAHRLVFAPRVPRDEHLRRHLHADLFLDTFHYGAHTTASDALRSGLPVLTRAGDTFVSRVASSLVVQIGTPELAVTDGAAYEALALALAHSPDRIAELKARIVAHAPGSSIFDVPGFTREMESLYAAMHARSQAGLPPAHIAVD